MRWPSASTSNLLGDDADGFVDVVNGIVASSMSKALWRNGNAALTIWRKMVDGNEVGIQRDLL